MTSIGDRVCPNCSRPLTDDYEGTLCPACLEERPIKSTKVTLTDHENRAKAFRDTRLWYPGAFGGGGIYVGTKDLLAELDWAEKNPRLRDGVYSLQTDLGFAYKEGEKIGWHFALAFVRSLLEEPKEKR